MTTSRLAIEADVRVLFLAANPDSTQVLALDLEIRAIREKISQSQRQRISLESRWAVRPDDLRQALLEFRPHIVHFSGHGTDRAEILLLGDDNRPQAVSRDALVNLFKILKDDIKVVLLNACYSAMQAREIADVVDYAIGMNKEIGDDAAIVFSSTFYQAIAHERSVREAFALAVNALELRGIPEEHTPELLEGAVASARKPSAPKVLEWLSSKKYWELGSRPEGLVVVCFFDPASSVCQKSMPTLEALAASEREFEFAVVDVQREVDLKAQLGIDSSPTWLFLRRGKVVGRQIGRRRLAEIAELAKKLG